MFGYARLTLKERPKAKTDHTRRFAAHDFPHVGLPSETSRTNNNRVISTFMFGYARLTLKDDHEGEAKGQIRPHQKILGL